MTLISWGIYPVAIIATAIWKKCHQFHQRSGKKIENLSKNYIFRTAFLSTSAGNSRSANLLDGTDAICCWWYESRRSFRLLEYSSPRSRYAPRFYNWTRSDSGVNSGFLVRDKPGEWFGRNSNSISITTPRAGTTPTGGARVGRPRTTPAWNLNFIFKKSIF